ncbi:hypothetical protein MW887_001786 [Aspergillus wentii]|nr:hypothetical protein MW887_001786 [Aspergillus wentii]
MRYFSIITTLLTASVGFVAAEDSSPTAAPGTAPTASSASCPAQEILDACLKSMKPQLQHCASNDWKCLCEQSNNVLTCYNNCTHHPDRDGAKQSKESYCSAAEANSALNTSTLSAATPTSTLPPSAASTTTSAATESGTNFSKGAAAGLNIEAGTLVAAAVVAGLGAAL